jgi:hypothetical protein
MSNLETETMLKTKVAVIYGAGGGIAGAGREKYNAPITLSPNSAAVTVVRLYRRSEL